MSNFYSKYVLDNNRKDDIIKTFHKIVSYPEIDDFNRCLKVEILENINPKKFEGKETDVPLNILNFNYDFRNEELLVHLNYDVTITNFHTRNPVFEFKLLEMKKYAIKKLTKEKLKKSVIDFWESGGYSRSKKRLDLIIGEINSYGNLEIDFINEKIFNFRENHHFIEHKFNATMIHACLFKVYDDENCEIVFGIEIEAVNFYRL